jgi:hypothetical protein
MFQWGGCPVLHFQKNLQHVHTLTFPTEDDRHDLTTIMPSQSYPGLQPHNITLRRCIRSTSSAQAIEVGEINRHPECSAKRKQHHFGKAAPILHSVCFPIPRTANHKGQKYRHSCTVFSQHEFTEIYSDPPKALFFLRMSIYFFPLFYMYVTTHYV